MLILLLFVVKPYFESPRIKDVFFFFSHREKYTTVVHVVVDV